MSENLPRSVEAFSTEYAEVWEAFNRLGNECHEAGKLDESTRRLVKIALCIGAGLEGGTRSAVRNAAAAGISANDIKHVAVLSITTLGFPEAIRAMTWVEDCLSNLHADSSEK